MPDAVRAFGLLPPTAMEPAAASLWAAMASAGLALAPLPMPAWTAAGDAPAPAAAPPTRPAVFGERPSDELAPLRTALRAAGLLAAAELSKGETAGPPSTG
jgi:hypothetical protein